METHIDQVFGDSHKQKISDTDVSTPLIWILCALQLAFSTGWPTLLYGISTPFVLADLTGKSNDARCYQEMMLQITKFYGLRKATHGHRAAPMTLADTRCTDNDHVTFPKNANGDLDEKRRPFLDRWLAKGCATMFF